MAELTTCLQDEVTDLAELQHAHMQYLAQTHHHCLMSQSTREVRAIIEPVLQCIVEFANNCRYVYETQICSRPTVIPVARHQLSSNTPHHYGADSDCSTVTHKYSFLMFTCIAGAVVIPSVTCKTFCKIRHAGAVFTRALRSFSCAPQFCTRS